MTQRKLKERIRQETLIYFLTCASHPLCPSSKDLKPLTYVWTKSSTVTNHILNYMNEGREVGCYMEIDQG